MMQTQVTFCFHGEEHLAVIETSFGKQLLIASCGPFGERETTGLLKMKRNQWKILIKVF